MRDRFPLLMVSGVVFLAVLGVFLVRGARRGAFAEELSTHGSRPEGARGLYLVLEQAGLRVSRGIKRLDLIEPGQPLVLLGIHGDGDSLEGPAFDGSDGGVPAEEEAEYRRFRRQGLAALAGTALSTAERDALLAHVNAGATVVYAVPGGGDSELLDALGVTAIRASQRLELRTLRPVVPSPYTRGVRTLEAPVRAYLEVSGEAVPILEDEVLEEVVAAVVSYGQGRFIVLGAPDLAANRHLGKADNARFWLSTISAMGRGTQRPVSFDEFHHGFTSDRSLAEFASRYGLQYAVAQFLAGVALWALALRRFGRPRELTEAARAAATDALSATSRLYQEGGHHHHAAQAIARGLAQAMAPRAGVAGRSSPDQVAAALTHAGRPALARALSQVSHAARLASRPADVEKVAQLAVTARRLLAAHHRTPPRP